MPPREIDRRSVDSAEATLARDIERTWRGWKAFVAEKLDELAAQQADDSPEADLTSAATPAPRKAKLDAATRQQFGAVLEARRQQAQAKAEREAREQGRAAPDADLVYAELLKHMLAELDGAMHPSGMALVWYKDALIKFDAAALSAGTSEADYLASGAGKGPTKQQAALLIGLIVAMIAIAVFMARWAFGGPAPDRALANGTARVAGASVQLWKIDRAAIDSQAVPAQLAGSYPPVLCVDSGDAELARPGASVVLSSTQAIRRYQVQPITSAAADLLLSDCTSSPPAPKRAAQLIESQTHTILPESTLIAASARGPDLDPQSIPAGQMELTIDVALPDAGAGTLILADGRRWSATRSLPTQGGTRLVYLVPLAQTAQQAGWELPHGDRLPELLVIGIPAPTGRAALLRQVLEVQAGPAKIAEHNGERELSLDLTLTLASGAEPIALLSDDLALLANGLPAAARWEAPQLAPGQTTHITVRAPARSGETLELALANWRARAEITE